MREEDELIFQSELQALQNHEAKYAKALSVELSQVLKINKLYIRLD